MGGSTVRWLLVLQRRTCTDASIVSLLAAKVVKAQPAAVPVSQKRYQGIVEYFRGSYGRVVCEEVSAMYRGFDYVFLHKTKCDFRPRQWDKVSFRLVLDDKGNPQGADARLVVEPERVSARDYFSRGR